MSITKLEALKIVQAVEEAAPWGYDDHAYGVVESAFNDLARRLSEALDVPACTCKHGHGSSWYVAEAADCPRTAIEQEVEEK